MKTTPYFILFRLLMQNIVSYIILFLVYFYKQYNLLLVLVLVWAEMWPLHIFVRSTQNMFLYEITQHNLIEVILWEVNLVLNEKWCQFNMVSLCDQVSSTETVLSLFYFIYPLIQHKRSVFFIPLELILSVIAGWDESQIFFRKHLLG